MSAVAKVRRVATEYSYPGMRILLMEARKQDRGLILEEGCNTEHAIGAEISRTGCSNTRIEYPDLKRRPNDPCDALCFVPADIPWVMSIDGSGEAAGISCRFEKSYFRSATGLNADWSPVLLEHCQDFWNANTRNLLSLMFHEMRNPGFSTEAVLESMANVILINISRYFRSSAGNHPGRVPGALSDRHLHMVKEQIESLDGSRLSIREIALSLGFSESQFYKIFKKSTGMTPHAFIEMVKTAQAIHLLSLERLPIKIVSHKLGFASQSSFSMAFRRMTGRTPRDGRTMDYRDFLATRIEDARVRSILID